jgi:NAD(P)-dependent dehydrogenase (short-subunit alcohol dehydrogenase family)
MHAEYHRIYSTCDSGALITSWTLGVKSRGRGAMTTIPVTQNSRVRKQDTMARILITGSSDGLGSIVAQKLISRGHSVVLHARNDQRAKDATAAAPGAEGVVTGDLSDISSTKSMAKQINDMGSFDCIIHNAGLYRGGFRKTSDGIPALAAVNTFAPYILTALVNKPKRLVFLSSEMHQSGSADLSDPLWAKRGESGFSDTTSYCASKLHNILFAKAFARRWPEVQSNALDPGWVATKMGGKGATGSAEAAVETYVMLAEGEEDHAKKSGEYFRPEKRIGSPQKATNDEKLQDRLLEICSAFSDVSIQ